VCYPNPGRLVKAELQKITVGATRRIYLLAVPSDEPSALLLSLHGTRSNARGQMRLSRMVPLVESGLVVAFPQASLPVGSGFEWDHYIDMAFLLELISELRVCYPTAATRVCMTGMSGGARMACYFASLEPELVAAVGAVAGLRAPESGNTRRAVPIVAFHGTADRINPYEGSETARWQESVPEAARRWAVANGVDSDPVTTAVAPGVTRTTYGVQGQPGEVTLWTVQGGGHTWPGSPLPLHLRLFLGRTTTAIDATKEIWSFAQPHLVDR
jgi:polyhydroxybutyrate depolymerase